MAVGVPSHAGYRVGMLVGQSVCAGLYLLFLLVPLYWPLIGITR